MKELTDELKTNLIRSQSLINTKYVAWNEIYDSEEELLEDMLSTKLILNGTSPRVCRGYAYIDGFRKYYEKNHKLTDKQMSQLKRLASSIAYNLYCRIDTGWF